MQGSVHAECTDFHKSDDVIFGNKHFLTRSVHLSMFDKTGAYEIDITIENDPLFVYIHYGGPYVLQFCMFLVLS